MKKLLALLCLLATLAACSTSPKVRRIKVADLPLLPPSTVPIKKNFVKGAERAPAAATAIVPGPGLSITNIDARMDSVELSWTPPGQYTLHGGPTAAGPWSAISNVTGGSIVITRFESNLFYRLSQPTLKLERYYVGGNVWFTFVGDNNISFFIPDLDWTQGPDFLMTLTNGILTGFPLYDIPPCAPFAAAVDIPRAIFYTLEGGCYYGPTTGPYVVRDWQLYGQDGFYTNAVETTNYTAGGFGDSWGDLLRLDSGALIWCRKSEQGYHWHYRSVAGVWQEIFRTDIPMGPTIMAMGQHPDGTIYTAITRDAYHHLALVAIKEQNNQVAFSSLHYIHCEGEWPEPSLVPDHANNRLILSRNVDPYFPWHWQEWVAIVKGSDMMSAFIYSENSILESAHIPASNVRTENAQNMNEPVNPHAAVMANGKLWLIRQEFNPREWQFNLTYAAPWENDHWGDRTFLYRAADCNYCRGKSQNGLMNYRNLDPNPTRLMFGNYDEKSEYYIFELK